MDNEKIKIYYVKFSFQPDFIEIEAINAIEAMKEFCIIKNQIFDNVNHMIEVKEPSLTYSIS